MKHYQNVEIELILFGKEDVLTTSGDYENPNEKGQTADDIYGSIQNAWN